MKYPYLKKITEEIADGGIKMLLTDMIIFTIKYFIIIFLLYYTIFAIGYTLNDILFSKMSQECLNQIENIINANNN